MRFAILCIVLLIAATVYELYSYETSKNIIHKYAALFSGTVALLYTVLIIAAIVS